ncbi:vWA domain-containing protein [Cryptosporangium phraense]|uniref:VWA domain-containing protein n=1 Tax=Cryptosporangium phraense TaxID=2593070 RepID=A0A545AUC9_9ACTN|nr:VWA domain-containing protein [Cryptosporangium phraense]TQS44940.1 VWA domain-containing protein [Cryptosporangium phraense]
MTVTGRLVEFVAALREHGLQIGPGETVDAAGAVSVLGLADREQLRHGLAATLLRRSGHEAVFDAVFDLYFPGSTGAPEAARGVSTIEDLREALTEALVAGDSELMAQLAAEAVAALGAYGAVGEGSSPGAGGWSAHQALERLRPQTLIARVAERMASGEFADRFARDEARSRVEEFERLVASEARRRVAEVRGRDRIARYSVPKAVDHRDFVTANREQLAALRRTVAPLSRRLATRLGARRRRRRRGELDLRRTFRRSLSTGGVAMSPAFRKPRPGRPDIVLLCDVSGSVAGFAHFTLMLVEALHDQFSRVRAFAFVDATAEVTSLVADNDADPAGLVERILAESGVVRWDGHSNYGRALRDFVTDSLDAIGPRTSVLILGDARTNGGDPNLAALRQVVGRAKRVYWLNPEPRNSWGSGDSATDAYRTLVDMYECRNADQLTKVIGSLLPV